MAVFSDTAAKITKIYKNHPLAAAECILTFMCVVWGVTFPLMSIAISHTGAYIFVFFKFFLSLLVFIPFVTLLFKHNSNDLNHASHFSAETNKSVISNKRLLVFGALLGSFYYFACLFQSLGIARISSGRNAFITGLVVVVVPLVNCIWHRVLPKKLDLFSIIFVLIGMYFLLDPLHTEANLWGDILSFIGTIFFAIHVQLLSELLRKYSKALIFAFYQSVFCAIYAAIAVFFNDKSPIERILQLPFKVWFCLVILGSVVMGGTFFLQAKFQHVTTSSRAALIYNLHPVFAALTAYFVLNERMGPKAIFGGSIMVITIAAAQVYQGIRESRIREKWAKTH